MTDNAHKAAGEGRRLNIWRPTSAGPNASMLNIGQARNRSRDLARNDPWASAAIERSVSNGVGVGIQAKGKWGSADYKAAEKRLWNKFINRADADGVLDFYGLQALAWREWREAGEVFARIRPRRSSDGLPVPVQVQLIESEQCPHDYYAMNGRNKIEAGIELFNGRPVAYWMYGEHPGEWSSSQTINASTLKRIPADEIIHLYKPRRAGQRRGTPDSIAAIVRLWNLGNFDDAVLERQKIANLFALFYTRDKSGDTIYSEDEQTADTDSTPLVGLEPGTAQELPEGVKPEFSNPPSAGSDYPEFYRTHLMAAAAAYGVPYEVLTGDLRDVSDRSLKLILNEFRRLIEMDQWIYMIPQFCQRIRESYFDAAILSGALVVDGYDAIRDDVVETLWVPQGWPYSHPVQDVTADIKAIDAGLQSRTATILANGDDPEEVDQEIAEDNARASALGLAFGLDAEKQMQNQLADPALQDQNQ